jgi:hypothetical protein
MRVLITFMLILISNIAISQVESFDRVSYDTTANYPTIKLDENGNKLVVFTLEQASKIDSKLEILSILEQNSTKFIQYDLVYMRLLNEKDETINLLERQILELNDILSIKNIKIENKDMQLLNYVNIESLLKREVDNKNKEINIYQNKVKKMERRFIAVGIGLSILTGILIFK